MKQKPGLVLTIIALVLCGLPGIFSALGGIFITGFGLLADKAQLKLDTNLDQSSVIGTGLGGICLGFLLIAIPVLIWLWSKRQKRKAENQ
jgi:hypothetical protein